MTATDQTQTKLVIGQHVHCVLHWAGEGIVYQIEGEQAPGTIRSIGNGCGVTGGRALFDVVFFNGHRSRKLPEAIIRSSQWSVLDTVADEAEIREALAYADAEEARKKAKKEAEARDHAAAVDRLRNAPKYAHLTQGDDRYSGKLAAQNIRKALKTAFPRVKFSVRKSHHGTVDIRWQDGPTVEAVEDITNRYQRGRFDGMDDSYKAGPNAWCEVFGGADYVFATREHSAALITKAIALVFEKYAGNFADTGITATADDYAAGRLLSVQVPGLHAHSTEDLQSLIRQEAANLST